MTKNGGTCIFEKKFLPKGVFCPLQFIYQRDGKTEGYNILTKNFKILLTRMGLGPKKGLVLRKKGQNFFLKIGIGIIVSNSDVIGIYWWPKKF